MIGDAVASRYSPLRKPTGVLTDRYFEVQPQRIREIRLWERKFYQKITDT